MKKKYFAIFVFLFLLPVFVFAIGTEVHYPVVPNATVPNASTTFPQYVKYLVNLAIIISGVIALGVIIWGGFLCLTSAGSEEQVREGKGKITKALFGLLVILFSYILLSLINPELTLLTLRSTGHTYGIYLINDSGKKFWVGKSFKKSDTDYSNINRVEFISPSSTLSAIYLYDGEKYQGDEERMFNLKIAGIINVHHPKSIYFLENKPGVYLCSVTTTEDVCPKRPLYVSQSTDNLANFNFDDKAESIQIKNSADRIYGALLFQKPGYVSATTCPSVLNTNIPDLDHFGPFPYTDSNEPPIGRNILSSIVVYYLEYGKLFSGDVIFYNEPACLPGASSTTQSVGSLVIFQTILPAGFWNNNVKSLKINGQAGVLLMTENPWGSGETGQCQFFSREDIDETNCIRNLPNTVYDPVETSTRPSSAKIIPYF